MEEGEVGVDFLSYPTCQQRFETGYIYLFPISIRITKLQTHCHLNNRPNIPNPPHHFPTPFPSHRTIAPRYGISLNSHSNRNVNWKASRNPSRLSLAQHLYSHPDIPNQSSNLSHHISSSSPFPWPKIGCDITMVCHRNPSRPPTKQATNCSTRYEIYYELLLGGRFSQQVEKLHQRYGECSARTW